MSVKAKVIGIFYFSVCQMNEAEDKAVVYIELNAGSHGEKQQLIETKKSSTHESFLLDKTVLSKKVKGMW